MSVKKLIEITNSSNLTSKDLFNLVSTYGFPIEIVKCLEELLVDLNNSKNIKTAEEILNSINSTKSKININKLKIDFKEFDELFDKHRLLGKSNENQIALEQQNSQLLNLSLESSFDYEIEEVKNSTVLKIFDENWNDLKSIKDDTAWIILDKTCFFATTGGQQHDTGEINGFNVVDVIKSPQGYHLHKVENCSLKVGDKVNGKINSLSRKIIRKQHSSEHLMHSALKRIISQTIKQEGAFKSIEKITLDFSFNRKLTYKEILDVEKEVKRMISKATKTEVQMKTLEEAKEMGAVGYFEDVYKKIKGKLRVLVLCPESIEICGGTHVYNTSEIEDFMITGIFSKGSGSWRIEAISSNLLVDKFKKTVLKNAIDSFNDFVKEYKEINIKDEDFEKYLKINPQDVHYLELKDINDILKNKINILRTKKEKENLEKKSLEIKEKFTNAKDKVKLVAVKGIDRKLLFNSLILAINESKETVFLVTNEVDESIQIIICCNEKFAKENSLNLNIYAKKINEKLGGKSGGRDYLIQGTILRNEVKELNKVLEEISEKIK